MGLARAKSSEGAARGVVRLLTYSLQPTVYSLASRKRHKKKGPAYTGPSTPNGVSSLQRAQEVEDILRGSTGQGIEAIHNSVRLRCRELRVGIAAVGEDRRAQVRRAAIVQEEDALSNAPERRRPEL